MLSMCYHIVDSLLYLIFCFMYNMFSSFFCYLTLIPDNFFPTIKLLLNQTLSICPKQGLQFHVSVPCWLVHVSVPYWSISVYQVLVSRYEFQKEVWKHIKNEKNCPGLGDIGFVVDVSCIMYVLYWICA